MSTFKTSPATRHDARFFARIDTISDGSDVQERCEYWQNWQFSEDHKHPNAFVVQLGSLYVGYIALFDEHEEPAYRMRVTEKFDPEGVAASMLLERAGVNVSSVQTESQGQFVA